MYKNLTDSELIRLQPNTDLEAELIARLTGSTEQDWDELNERLENWFRESRESNEIIEKLKGALAQVMTEIHRCADFGIVEISPAFRKHCEQVVCAVDELIAYPYPTAPLATQLTKGKPKTDRFIGNCLYLLNRMIKNDKFYDVMHSTESYDRIIEMLYTAAGMTTELIQVQTHTGSYFDPKIAVSNFHINWQRSKESSNAN